MSPDEARQGYLLVEKRRLRFFPPPGAEFELDGAPARVESFACSCRGPEKQHEHWFVRLPGLHPDAEVEVVDLGGGRYGLRGAGDEALDQLP